MNDKLAFVLDHLMVQSAFPSKILFEVADWYDHRQAFDTFTRLTWRNADAMIGEIEVEAAEGPQKIHIFRFKISTRTRLVRMGPEGLLGDDKEPAPEDVVFDANIDFMVEYLVHGCLPTDLDEDAVSEYSLRNVPYHLWPFYRELIQSLAVRARIPPPNVPSFRVPKSHQKPAD